MKQSIYFSMITRRQLLWIIVVIVLTASVIIAYYSTKKPISTHQTPLLSVSLATVKDAADIASLSAIGTVKAAQGIQVSAETAGIITSINFQSGQTVQAGQILVILKNDDLKATVQQDQAKYQLAQLNAERSQKLVGNGYISRADADKTASDAKQAEAQLAHDQALLQDTIIQAPFSGQLGISQVDLGQYVSAGQSIVSLQDRSTIYVDFSIPEKQSDLLHVGDCVLTTSHQGEAHRWQGKVIALGSQMNNDTRSLPVRAQLIPPYPNLTPGMYVDVSVLLPKTSDKPAVPQSAIVYNPYGNFVYLFQKGTVTQRYVILGPKVGATVLIENGLTVGDQVIVEGQQKLFNGAQVEVEGK
jgi:membrane fusion protein (multidrug efflux system)